MGPWSVDHGREPCRLISAQGLQSFKLHVSRLQRPLVALFEHHGADESDNGLVIGEDTDDVGASLYAVIAGEKTARSERLSVEAIDGIRA